MFACEHHADQRRKSGEDFITHPVGVARICAGMRLDTETLCAALLHDTVEDTSASLAEVRERFGDNDVFSSRICRLESVARAQLKTSRLSSPSISSR